MVWKNEGTLGTDVKPGMRVRVVLKKDQRSGILTEGIVRDLLTRSASHLTVLRSDLAMDR